MCLPRYLCICRPTGEYRAEFFSKKNCDTGGGGNSISASNCLELSVLSTLFKTFFFLISALVHVKRTTALVQALHA